MAVETCLILPQAMAPAPGRPLCETPYGTAVGLEQDGLTILLREEGGDARAWIYAAKAMGARRLLAAEQVSAVSPLLEPGDLVIPADLIDQTRLRPFTFFVGKGYGFIKLNPPFCPDLMALALSTARCGHPRSFKGAVYVGAEGPRDATPAELRMYRHWGADLIGTDLVPEAYLARELEMCYAAVTVVGEGNLYPLLAEVAGLPSGAVPCT
jgi:purine nucleoside phosphorylase